MRAYPPLLLSRTGEHEADIVWDDEQKSLALGGVTYEFAERVVACVNACKDISTEHLTQFPNWTLAVANMARPGDVANLILKLGAYREALAKIAARPKARSSSSEYELSCQLNACVDDALEVLK